MQHRKNILLLICFLFATFSGFSQSHLGWTTKKVNFREGPGRSQRIIYSLAEKTQIFIISAEGVSDYYHAIDIKNDIEGYIHKSFIKLGQIVEFNNKGIFQASGKTLSEDPEIEIFNNTSLSLTLKLNNEKYTFPPKEKRKISLSAGSYYYRASAPGVIPNIGTEVMENNMGYTWQFYIVQKESKRHTSNF